MELGYVGSLRDLNTQQVVLREGLEVTVYSDSDDAQDFEMDGIVQFGSIHRSPKCWYVLTDPGSSRYVDVKRDNLSFTIPCFKCRSDISESISKGTCSVCGLDVDYARRRA